MCASISSCCGPCTGIAQTEANAHTSEQSGTPIAGWEAGTYDNNGSTSLYNCRFYLRASFLKKTTSLRESPLRMTGAHAASNIYRFIKNTNDRHAQLSTSTCFVLNFFGGEVHFLSIRTRSPQPAALGAVHSANSTAPSALDVTHLRLHMFDLSVPEAASNVKLLESPLQIPTCN